MDMFRFGKLESGRNIAGRAFKRFVACGLGLAVCMLFRVPLTNAGISITLAGITFATVAVVGGGALADAYRLRKTKGLQNKALEDTSQ